MAKSREPIEVNGRRLTSTDDCGKLVAGAGKGEYLRLYIVRSRPAPVPFFALVKIEE